MVTLSAEDQQREDAPRIDPAMLHAVADAAVDSIFVKDRDRRYTFVNRTMCRLFGCQAADLLGRTPDELFDPISALAIREVDDRTFAGEEVHATRTLSIAGAPRFFQTTQMPLFDANGRVEAICGFVRDITEQRMAQEHLRHQQEFADSLADLAPAIILVMDLDGRVIRYNRYVEELTGVLLRDALGQDWFERFLPPDEFDRVKQFFVREATVGETSGSINGVRCRDGAHRQVQWHSRPLRHPDGSPFQVLAVGLDITERLHAEEERRRLEREMMHAQKLESLGVLAGGIAHDFNNILVSVLGHASLATRDVAPGSPPAEALHRIEVAASRASGLCNQLLAYSGHGTLTRERLDLNALVTETLDLLRVSVAKNAVLAWEPDPEPLHLVGDATQIRQVILNLVTNASEAVGTAPGRISLTTAPCDLASPPEGEHFVTDPPKPGSYCRIRVADTGLGMDDATLARIFDPFFSTKFPGRGLGLSAVLGIVREHGGALSVRSSPGNGTTFEVLLPRTEGVREEPAPTPLPQVSATHQGDTVLVVDDEPANLEVIRAMLGRVGFQVRTAGDGDEGVARLREAPESFRLVILDLTMPRLNGAETLRLMRRLRPDLPVVVMSGYGHQEALQQLAETRHSVFLPKPFSMAGLLAAVESVLRTGTA